MARNSLFLLLAAARLSAEIPEDQRRTIDRLTGAKGTYTGGEDVYRVAFPRNDVAVRVEGRAMHPFQGLTSWAAFTPHSASELMVMGDLVLFEDEVNPAMSAALDGGLEVTALHNHFFFDSPKVMFMHIGGHGPADRLASAIKACMDRVKEIRTAKAQPESGFGGVSIPETNSISAATIDGILGTKGQVNSGMYKAQIGREAKMHGRAVSNQMGVNTWAAFAGTDDAAVVDGDFAMLEGEMQAVLNVLRKGGIQIVAIHQHMAGERPQYFFLHYWGKGKAQELARTLRSALDAQQPRAASQVVFMCEHGAAKSVIAATYFNKLAAERGLSQRAITRGTNIDPAFGEATVNGLRADGFAPLPGAPKRIEASDLTAAGRLVTFGVEPPSGLPTVKREDWNVPGPSANYGVARDAIKAKVELLIADLAKSSGH